MSEMITESTTTEAGPTAYEVAKEAREREVRTSNEMDAELHAVWDRMNGTAALEKEFQANPPMPSHMAKSTKDELEWYKSPLKDRQAIATFERENRFVREQAEALGLKVETAADVEAVRRMLKGETGVRERPAIDAETQASLDTFKTIVPNAKDHREASKFLNDLADQVSKDPVKGGHAVLAALGMRVEDLLTAEQRQLLSGQSPQVEPQPTGEEAVVKEWQKSRRISDDDVNAMLALVESGKFKLNPDESIIDGLNRAHKAMQRSRPSRRAALDSSLEESLRSVAARRYGGVE